MTQASDSSTTHSQNSGSLDQKVRKTEKIKRVEPTHPPRLVSDWVVWEMNTCIDTKGVKFTTGQLHDCLKYLLGKGKTPVDIFLAQNACWIIEGLQGRRARVDNDLRARVVATLRDSPYTDMQFIAGIDYFGESHWADIQMMLVLQPQKIEVPPKPSKPNVSEPSALIPTEILIILAVFAVCFLMGNIALKFLGLMGLAGIIYLYIQSNENVRKARKRYEDMTRAYEEKLEKWEVERDTIIQDREELVDHRLSRSFKLDDLRVFHTVMVRSVAGLSRSAKIVTEI